jgi:hypothetical protein
MTVKHKFQSAKSDGADATLVRPSNWNDTHDVHNLQTTYAANQALAWGTDETVLGNAGATDITLTLPTAVGHAGERMRVKRINSAAGNVIVDGNGSETIDGGLTYTLTNQYQFVELESDGANWLIVGLN